MPVTGHFCSLCKVFLGDLDAAAMHMRGKNHYVKYQVGFPPLFCFLLCQQVSINGFLGDRATFCLLFHIWSGERDVVLWGIMTSFYEKKVLENWSCVKGEFSKLQPDTNFLILDNYRKLWFMKTIFSLWEWLVFFSDNCRTSFFSLIISSTALIGLNNCFTGPSDRAASISISVRPRTVRVDGKGERNETAGLRPQPHGHDNREKDRQGSSPEGRK